LSIYFLFVLLAFLPIILFAPERLKGVFSLIITLTIAIITSSLAISVLNYGTIQYSIGFSNIFGNFDLRIDALSAFFMLIINIGAVLSSIYSLGYLKKYSGKLAFNLHYMSFSLLYFSMLMVCMLQNLLQFMLVWEFMTIASFFLVIFEGDKDETRKAAINYFVQMHVCICIIMLGAFILQSKTGQMSFVALKIYFRENDNLGLFMIFFIGFGMKSGFVPLHSWLPGTYSVAPSHVSALLSGVMKKMGLYGILRMCSFVQSSYYEIGVTVLIISMITGLFGILNAISQNDIKKSLAYSCVENVGIIGIGIGLGLIGLGVENYSLAFLGFSGAMLHIFNHSLFKPLLYFSAGAVYQQTNAKSMSGLGGVMKNMPITAVLFLIGSLAICGLPPFNGFMSKFLIYNGIIGEFNKGNVTIDIMLMLALFVLSLIGGLAIFSFTKLFGIVFLGNPRTKLSEPVQEATFLMQLPQYLLVAIILTVAVFPAQYLAFITDAINILAPVNISIPIDTIHTLSGLSLATIIFLIIFGGVFFIRNYFISKNGTKIGETWGCGYGVKDAKVQYTPASYANSIEMLMGSIVDVKTQYKELQSHEYFPKNRELTTITKDIIDHSVIAKYVTMAQKFLKRMGVLQSGNTQAYVLYSFLFIVILFIITILGII
jgi:formate hydrogenlyase subunit 3/multisubunit Na+/H+ antiporter MnhD subunit